jgi:hypothetical protein
MERLLGAAEPMHAVQEQTEEAAAGTWWATRAWVEKVAGGAQGGHEGFLLSVVG